MRATWASLQPTHLQLTYHRRLQVLYIQFARVHQLEIGQAKSNLLPKIVGEGADERVTQDGAHTHTSW